MNQLSRCASLITTICIALTQVLSAQSVAQASAVHTAGSVTVRFKETPLSEAIEVIAGQSGIRVMYSKAMLPNRRVTYDGKNVMAEAALSAILRGTEVRIERFTDGTLRLVPENVRAGHGQGVITGKVTDAKTGKGISGVSVSLGNDTRGVVSDESGIYRLAGVSTGAHTVTVRLVGYAKQTRSVTVGEGATVTADFKLEPSASVLDQVVVTGTVVASELKSVPNAITVITAKQIEERGITSIAQLFRGDIPGLFVQSQGSGNPLDTIVMFSRGANQITIPQSGTVGGVTTPSASPIKTYIDGVELANSAYLNQIDPKSIEKIEILSGPQASTIYGSNALGGVMQIFTKRGNTPKPQITATLSSGIIENNVSKSLTPYHDYSGDIRGIEGRISYNTGGSWNHQGAWSPDKQFSRYGVYGGARGQLRALSVDLMMRSTTNQNQQSGPAGGLSSGVLYVSGRRERPGFAGIMQPTTETLLGQTRGLGLVYTPMAWWLHDLNIGSDRYDRRLLQTEPTYATPRGSDTLLLIRESESNRRSLRYSSTVKLSLGSTVAGTLVAGGEGWNILNTSVTSRTATLTGSLTGVPGLDRVPDHNRGGFVQGQLGIADALFVTYGVRGEWNPAFGSDAQPNVSARYGLAYTREFGSFTAKLRSSYGRSTRPPLRDAKKDSQWSADIGIPSEFWGLFYVTRGNPDLGPEFQQGGEGGVEIYVSNFGSLEITRYNQTVDALIALVVADSVDLLPEVRHLFGVGEWQIPIYRNQNVNVGSIRNQGWELRGTINTGPITTRGTYSWTKSRMIGITPKFRQLYPASDYPQLQPGATFQYVPEHTWALGTSYSRNNTTVMLNLTGTGFIYPNSDWATIHSTSSTTTWRNSGDLWRASNAPATYRPTAKGYVVADVNASQRFTKSVEGILQIQNLQNQYLNDFDAGSASIGRQSKIGVRWRL